MRFSVLFRAAAVLALVTAGSRIAAAQSLPPIRPLGAVTATAPDTFTTVNTVRALSNGAVLVNDVAGRRVLLYDPSLAEATVVADSTSATGNAYAGRIGGVIAYRGDSSLFVDPISLSMLVIDPAGKITRVMSVPRTQDAGLLSGVIGNAAFDQEGHLVYRGNNFVLPRPTPNANGGPPQFPEQPDTAPIVRVNLETRQLDTVAFIKVPKISMSVSQDANGRIMMSSKINPLPTVDEWAILSDGTVALLRHDYHVDYVGADKSVASSPKIPFEWQRLTDEDKAAFIDSVRAVRERMLASGDGAVLGQQNIRIGAPGAAAPRDSGGRGAGAAPGRAGGDGGGRQQVIMFGGDGGGRGAGPPPGFAPPQMNFVDPSELPDYKPAFLAGAARADANGNLWVRTVPTKAYPGGPIYDVIDRKGQLVDRVQVPANRLIVGFSASGDVFLAARENNKTTIEKAKVR